MGTKYVFESLFSETKTQRRQKKKHHHQQFLKYVPPSLPRDDLENYYNDFNSYVDKYRRNQDFEVHCPHFLFKQNTISYMCTIYVGIAAAARNEAKLKRRKR